MNVLRRWRAEGMEEIRQGYLVIGAGLGIAALMGLGFVMWMLAAISAICDDREGVRDE
jgi:hypothetical protein